jgi:V8-like Glu-specific endopeptidase
MLQNKKKPSLFTRIIAIALMVTLASISAFAAQTPLTTIVLVQNNAAVTAGQLTLTFTACDTVNGNSFTATGREVLIVNNTGASPYTFTVTSVADNLGRTDTSLTTYSVAAGVITGIQMKYLTGWVQSGTQNVYLACSNAAVKYAVIQTN